MDVDIITMGGVLREATEAIQLQHTEADGTLYAQLPASASPNPGDSIGFRDINGRYRLFEISTRELREPDGYWEINAVDKAIRELMDEPITEQRARDISITTYLPRLLQNTRFSVGTVAVTPTGTSTAYYESVWSALVKTMSAFDVRLIPYYTLTGGLISGRYVDVVSTAAADKGRIFELGDDLTGISVQYDDSQIKTALYGRGMGVEISTGDSTDPAYGRRLTFADVIWTTSGGKPVNKPADQEWVGDPAALAAYGRDGRHRFGYVVFDQETDAETLLQKTWDYLQKVKDPVISITGTIRDMARLTGTGLDPVQYGESVLVRMDRRLNGQTVRTAIRASVVSVVRDYVQPEETRITIGNAVITAGSLIRQLTQTVDNYESRAAVWDRANAFDLQGVMDVMNNQITSTTGHWYTDPDSGALMFESTDGLKAMRLTGAGWQIATRASTSVSWSWRTAATGSGIVADMITSGIINAGLVTVGGTGTTLDGTSLTVKHPSISNTAQTVINAGGLQMLNAGTLLGGIIQLNGAYTAVIQALYNATYPNLKVDLGEFQGLADAVYGLLVKYNNTSVLRLGAGFIEGTLTTAEIIADKGLIIASNDEAVSLSAPHASIIVDDEGDIKFHGTKNGAEYTVSLHDIYHLID